jgi:hypothetical protein
MAKPVFGEEELRATRSRLDIKDDEDAKIMMKILGGEVGDVRADKAKPLAGQGGRKQPYTKSTPTRRVETADVSDKNHAVGNSASAIRLFAEELRYWERVKMDTQEASADFKIKTKLQAFFSKLSFFRNPPDVVNKVFVMVKMEDFFSSLNKLVNKVRLILPRNNTNRNKMLKHNYPLAFSILDTIRCWDIDKISSALTRIQSRPRMVLISDFVEIVREFYRPLIILEQLDAEAHITKAIKELNFMLKGEADNHITINTASEIVSLFNRISEDVSWQLYPFLLKYTSGTYIPGDVFFSERAAEIQAFLGITPDKIIQPDKGGNSSGSTASENAQTAGDDDMLADMPNADMGENPAEQAAPSNKPRAIQRGLDVLEQLFPEAGWDRLDTFPDIYHYFEKSLSLKKNADVVDPENPMLQALVLMQILEELFYGFRSIEFVGGKFELEEFSGIIDEWHKLIESCFERVYLPRLAEFVKLFYGPLDPKQKLYAMKLREELNWTTRLFLFPSLKIESLSQSPIHKKDAIPVFSKVRALRQSFTVIAKEIEDAMQSGGAPAQARCAVLNNPWDEYVFQVANPLSKRLNMLLDKGNRTNVSLIYYTLSVLTVLDYFLNNPNSWAYQTNTEKLFRSSDPDGLVPESLPEKAIDAEAIFKQSIEKLKARQAQK